MQHTPKGQSGQKKAALHGEASGERTMLSVRLKAVTCPSSCVGGVRVRDMSGPTGPCCGATSALDGRQTSGSGQRSGVRSGVLDREPHRA